jgi:hypothetical protein
MFLRAAKLVAVSALASGLLAGTASAASAPVTRSGKPAQLVASGVATPTSFAFGDQQVFMGDGSTPPEASLAGVYVLKNHKATKLAGSPGFVGGLAWKDGTLYVSASTKILAWSKWNGTKFTSRKTLWTGPKNFSGFNGIAFGPDGRLYAGVGLSATNDHSAPTTPYEYDIVSLTTAGKDLKIVATGIRQPWQIAFPPNASSFYVSDLGQDQDATNPPDFLLQVSLAGDRFGFPGCNWTVVASCQNFVTPYLFFPPHTDPGGLAITGHRLYISEFGFVRPAEVVSVGLGGYHQRVELSKFAPGHAAISLGSHNGWVYVGTTAVSASNLGAVYRFKAS